LDFLSFTLYIAAAVLMGFTIGIERQFRQHPAGLRTNVLVCVGAAMFTSLALLMHDTNSPTRMASYVVSGVGFLGGGVILREGLNVKGMNTAATLWCSAAIGVLCGSGFPQYALVGTFVILGIHLGLRPVAIRIDAMRKNATDVETIYRIRVTCTAKDEALIRTILLRHINSHSRMTTHSISTQDSDNSDDALVVADVLSMDQQDRIMQEVMSRLNIEPAVKSVRWEKVEQHAG
jgi:putative Mg2+ transporter-C (MgtC) family protein